MIAVNGSVESNGVNIFSPIYFLQEWVSGKTFKDAVKRAYERDIAKLKTYNNTLPIEEYLLDAVTLKNSIQLTGGIKSSLIWKKFPEEYKNKGTGPIVQAGSGRFNQ